MCVVPHCCKNVQSAEGSLFQYLLAQNKPHAFLSDDETVQFTEEGLSKEDILFTRYFFYDDNDNVITIKIEKGEASDG